MQESDRIRLQHMLDAAREAMAFAQGKSRADLETDRMLALSLVKTVEIIGEAARRVSHGVRAAAPEIPWDDIISLRNRLIHAYYNVDLDVLWETLSEDLQPLIAALERVLPAGPAQSSSGKSKP
jgi:uncharacterized protein with HEPN domain